MEQISLKQMKGQLTLDNIKRIKNINEQFLVYVLTDGDYALYTDKENIAKTILKRKPKYYCQVYKKKKDQTDLDFLKALATEEPLATFKQKR